MYSAKCTVSPGSPESIKEGSVPSRRRVDQACGESRGRDDAASQGDTIGLVSAGELTGDDQVLSDFALLVLVALHLYDRARRRSVGSEEDVVLSGDTKRDCGGTRRDEVSIYVCMARLTVLDRFLDRRRAASWLMTTRSRRLVRPRAAVGALRLIEQAQRTESLKRLRDSPSILSACVCRRAESRRRRQQEGQVQDRGQTTGEGISRQQTHSMGSGLCFA
jgi:hypothetical protein